MDLESFHPQQFLYWPSCHLPIHTSILPFDSLAMIRNSKMRAYAVAYPLLVCATTIDCFTAVTRCVFRRHHPATTQSLRSLPVTAEGNIAYPDHCLEQEPGSHSTDRPGEKLLWMAAPAALALCTAFPAEAADVVPSALWAYGHYLGMLLTMGSLVAEHVLIKPQMSSDEEKALRLADLVYVASLVFLLVSGGLRATEVRHRQHTARINATQGASHFLL
jgi:Predicted membrane protein (DUF2214)